MRAHIDLYVTVMFRNSLSRPDCELLAAVVSSLNACDYCVIHHAEALRSYWKDRDRVERLIRDYRTTDLTAAQLAMADYARRLTTEAASISEADVRKLRGIGFRIGRSWT